MNSQQNIPNRQSGFSMIEVVVTLIILLLGLLGLVGVMIKSQRSELESYQRVQALIMLQDIAGRIEANRNVASCYALTGTSGTPYLGTTGAAILPCATGTPQQQTQFNNDSTAWNQLLLGAAETLSASSVGSIIGARGCISYDDTTKLISPTTGSPVPGTGIYTIAVAWQGLDTTAIATSNCAQGLYGNDAQRRVVSSTLRIGSLTAL
ncbi:MAG TPA: type IV pilus modification protein PilV [Gallionella sp.]|nr:type IV pilus modification protein PilV [Gallionella sp.]